MREGYEKEEQRGTLTTNDRLRRFPADDPRQRLIYVALPYALHPLSYSRSYMAPGIGGTLRITW
jgi:hypothetical protein